MQELFIRNMVCNRCIATVEHELQQLGYTVAHIELGKVVVGDTPVDRSAIGPALERHGFTLLTDKTTQVVNQVKTLIINLIQSGGIIELRTTLSGFLANQTGFDYAYLSHLFSANENLTIEKFWIRQRVERVKELLSYDELPISEIAHQLGYSSAAYLTKQFKEVTGVTPAAYRNQQLSDRNPLDWI